MLESKSKRNEANNVEITVTVSAEEVDKEVQAAYKEANKRRIPGFRPGKAPRKILDNYYGGPDYFLAQTTDELVRSTAPIAVDEQGFVAMGQPEFAEFDLAKEGQEFVYSFSLDVTPELELSSYDAIKIELPSAEPTEEELQAQLDALRDYYVVEGEDGELVLPELTDAWVKETLEFESIDELKTRIYESIADQKAQDLPALREYRSSAEIAKRLVGEVPEDLVRQTEQDNYKDVFQSLQNNRITLDAYLESNGLTPETFRDEMHSQAHQSAAIALALDALGRNLGLKASDDEVKEEFAKSGAKNPEQLFENWRQNGRLSEVRQGLIRIKAAKHVYDTAEVFAPGTLEPAEEKPAKKKAAKKSDEAAKAKPAKAAKEAKDKADTEADTKPKTTSKPKTAKIDSNKKAEPKKTSKAKKED